MVTNPPDPSAFSALAGIERMGYDEMCLALHLWILC